MSRSFRLGVFIVTALAVLAVATFLIGDRQRLQFASLDMRQQQRDVFKLHLHLAGEQVRDCRRRALVRDVDEVDSGCQLEHFAEQMWLRTIAWG